MVKVDGLAARVSAQSTAIALLRATWRVVDAALAAAEASKRATTMWSDRTGETRGSIRARVSGNGLSARVSVAGAAKFLEGGTRPHVIRAKNTQALRFMVQGVVVFRRSVNHPGTKPRPFVAEARERAVQMLSYCIPEFLGAAIRGHSS